MHWLALAVISNCSMKRYGSFKIHFFSHYARPIFIFVYILFNRSYFMNCTINKGSVRSLLNILHRKSKRLEFGSHDVGSYSTDRYDVKKSTDTETKSHSRITVKWDDVLCQWKTPLPYICE